LKIIHKKNKKPFSKMLKGWKCLGSPDRTIFATFVCVRKLRMYVIRWKKSLGHVKDLKRQNLNKEVLPLLLSGSTGRSIGRTFSIIFKLPNP